MTFHSEAIPAQAVEAAAKALRTAPLHGVASWRDIAQTALEASAPHIRAQALEEAADGWDRRSGEFEDTTPGYLHWCADQIRPTP